MNKIKYILIMMVFSLTFLGAKSLRVELNELKNNTDKFVLVDTRNKKLYEKGHLKGAVNFPIELTYENQALNGKIVNSKKMQEIIRSLGLDVNLPVVIYDDGVFFDAARLFWSLEVYGFTNVKLLNAGYGDLIKNNFKIDTKPTKIKKSEYIAKINHNRLSTRFQTQIATKNPNQIIVDARAKNSFIGKQSTAKRFGHIPKAIHIPATHNISSGTDVKKIKSIDSLKELYKDVSKNKKIIIYCAVGRISTTNYFVLRELGYNVSNYDASWKEWGNDFALPIVNPSKK